MMATVLIRQTFEAYPGLARSPLSIEGLYPCEYLSLFHDRDVLRLTWWKFGLYLNLMTPFARLKKSTFKGLILS